MSKDIVVLKLGGASLQDESILSDIIRTIRDYRKYDYDVVLVHGGGPAINAELVRRNIKWEFINGQRKTTNEMMAVIEDVLFGKINSKLVYELNHAGIPSVGLSGSHNKMLLCQQASVELGQVGSINQVHTNGIFHYLNQVKNYVPVIAPIGIGEKGELYNINADWAASKIATALKAQKLIFLTDQTGILDEEKNVIPYADQSLLENLLNNGSVSGGMYTKVTTMLEALNRGVSQVRVLHGSQANLGLWSDYVGTFCGDRA